MQNFSININCKVCLATGLLLLLLIFGFIVAPLHEDDFVNFEARFELDNFEPRYEPFPDREPLNCFEIFLFEDFSYYDPTGKKSLQIFKSFQIVSRVYRKFSNLGHVKMFSKKL